LIQMVVMVDKAVPVVLEADIILHGEGNGGPGMSFKLGAVYKKSVLVTTSGIKM
jgi:hypothetical protein